MALGNASWAIPQQPFNLLIITADDLNCDSCGWMGSTVGATPNLDQFAATGHVFAHAHVAAPICQPSREALLTGRVPHRSGAMGFDPVLPDVPTLWETLHAAGYFTAGMNKLGHMKPDEKFNWDMRHDGGRRFDDSGRDPAAYHRNMLDAIDAAQERKQPFFINANIIDPHRPFYGTPQDRELSGSTIEEFREEQIVIPPFLDHLPGVRTEMTQYFNSVRRFDQSFGQIMRALDESGQADRTIVVFLSDHGISMPFAKTTLYHSGTSTPLIVRVPGLTQPRFDREHMIGEIDVMPTLLEVMGMTAPDGMDGRSFTPLLRGEKQPAREHVFTYMHSTSRRDVYPSRCVRTTTRAYIFNDWSDGMTRFRNEPMVGLAFKSMESAAADDERMAERLRMYLHRTPQEFYDLTADPGERRNLIADPARQHEIEQMKSLLLEQMRSTGDPLTDAFTAKTSE